MHWQHLKLQRKTRKLLESCWTPLLFNYVDVIPRIEWNRAWSVRIERFIVFIHAHWCEFNTSTIKTNLEDNISRDLFLKNMTFGTVPWERKQRKEAKECSVAGAKLAVLSCTSKSCDKIVSCLSCRKLLVLTNLIVILFKLKVCDLSIICNCRRFLKIKFPIACFDVPVFVTVFDRVSCQHPAFFWFRFSWREITQATLIRFFS